MMKYEGVKKLETVNAVERRVEDTITDTIIIAMSELGCLINNSLYELLYLAYIYSKKKKIDDNVYAEIEYMKKKVLKDTINSINIKRSFYFVYGSYVMTKEKKDIFTISYKHYLVSMLKQKEGLTVRIEELKEYEGPNMGRIRM